MLASLSPAFAADSGSPGVPPASGVLVVPLPAPGIYREPQLITLKRPDDTRLTVLIDGKALASPESPFLLSANPREERTFTVETELMSLAPAAAPIRRDRFTWRIDRRPPSVPSFAKKAVPGGLELSASLDEAGKVKYSIYHPYFKAVSGGSLEIAGAGKASPTRIFLPEGAVLCAYGADLAGNRGTVVSITDQFDSDDDLPFAVISPAPGNWANRQTLLIEVLDGTTIHYSLDGSDPVTGGKIYGGPVLLDKEGLVTLRLSAAGPDGRAWTREILFTVAPRPEPSLPFAAGGNGIVEVGDFAELQLPQGYTCMIGDPPSTGNGQTGILVSAIRGIRRFYPIIVTDGSSLWRWICSSGGEAVTGIDTTGGAPNAGPAVTIHDWHFISVDYQDPVYFSLDGSSWKRYTDPVLVDRASPMAFSCYSPAWNDSGIQTVSLPPKPGIHGIDEGGITANPVYLSVPDSPFSFHYRAGSNFSRRPSIDDPTLDSGLLVEIPNGSVSRFRMRFLAVHGGRVHGELGTDFTVDRKAPRSPSLGIPESMTYSRSPVRIVPNGEDMVQLSITPQLFRKDEASWFLQGDETKPIEYTIRAFSVDRAGNKSPLYEKKLTIDYNALYVDPSVGGNPDPDGSPQRPFSDLDSALEAVRGSGKWRIYLKGSIPLRRSHTIQAGITMMGTAARIEASGAPVLSIYGGSLAVSSCSFAKLAPASSGTLPLNASTPAFIEAVNGTLTLRDCSILGSGPGSASLIRAVRSSVSCTGTSLSLSAADYAILLDASDSNLYLSDCDLDVCARNASGVSASSGRMTVRASTVTVRADSAGRAFESWGASVVLQDNLLERAARADDGADARGASADAKKDMTLGNKDTAFWFDRKTVLVSDTGSTVKGFKYPRARAE